MNDPIRKTCATCEHWTRIDATTGSCKVPVAFWHATAFRNTTRKNDGADCNAWRGKTAGLERGDECHRAMPSYARASVTFYVTSPSTEVDSAMTLDGITNLDPNSLPEGLDVAVATLNAAVKVTDSRGMTADEVTDYLRRQREEEKEGEGDDV